MRAAPADILTLQKRTGTGQGGGVNQYAWGDVATVYGRLRPLRTHEYLSAGQQAGGITHVFESRGLIEYASGTDAGREVSVTPTDFRCTLGARTLEIRGAAQTDTVPRRWRFMLAEKQ